MSSLRPSLGSLFSDRSGSALAAVAAPVVAALVVGRSPFWTTVVILPAAVLAALSGYGYALRGASLGVALALVGLHGPVRATVAIAVAAIVAAALALVGAERVTARLPRPALNALLCGFAVAGVARWLGAPSMPSPSIVGDVLALALVVSLEAATIERPPHESAIGHVAAASCALPLTLGRRTDDVSLPLVLIAACALGAAVWVPAARPLLVVAGVGVAVATELVRSGRGLGIRGVVLAVAVAAVATHYRPAVAVLFALVVAALTFVVGSRVNVSSVENPERS